MTATAYWTKQLTSAERSAAYARTAIDDARDAADILVTACLPRNRTEIRTRKLLSGHGIKLEAIIAGVGRYVVSEAAMTELRRRFTVATDF